GGRGRQAAGAGPTVGGATGAGGGGTGVRGARVGGWCGSRGCPGTPPGGVSEANDAKGGEGAASARPRTRDRTRTTPRAHLRGPGKKSPGTPGEQGVPGQ